RRCRSRRHGFTRLTKTIAAGSGSPRSGCSRSRRGSDGPGPATRPSKTARACRTVAHEARVGGEWPVSPDEQVVLRLIASALRRAKALFVAEIVAWAAVAAALA